ncbi:MAG: TniQ family protein [Comamonas sp.]|jgi:hypothetical protein|nr:TniQ family protein [Comamonas sp.]
MHLLRPYPDELVGSMLNRASRETGIPMKRLLPLLTGARITSHSFVMTSYELLARSYGLSIEEFLLDHTLFPYVTGFMTSQGRERITEKLVSPDGSKRCIASLVQNATRSVDKLRFCPECCVDDQRKYGQTYWHRTHQLPCVYLCSTHWTPLHVSWISIQCKARISAPGETSGDELRIPKALGYELARRITEISTQALSQRTNTTPLVASQEMYQRRAIELGYGLSSKQVFGSVLSDDLRAFYSPRFLTSVDCAILRGTVPWPSLLLRQSSQNCTALKHVLMIAFLESNPSPSLCPIGFLRRQKAKKKSWGSIEEKAIQTMSQLVASHRAAGTKITMAALLEVTDIASRYRHQRSDFPLLTEWLKKFKASPSSKRQTEGHPKRN